MKYSNNYRGTKQYFNLSYESSSIPNIGLLFSVNYFKTSSTNNVRESSTSDWMLLAKDPMQYNNDCGLGRNSTFASISAQAYMSFINIYIGTYFSYFL